MPIQKLAAIDHFLAEEAPRRYRRETRNPFRRLARLFRPEHGLTLDVSPPLEASSRTTRSTVLDFSGVRIVYGSDKALAREIESLAASKQDPNVLAIKIAELERRSEPIELGPVLKKRSKYRWPW